MLEKQSILPDTGTVTIKRDAIQKLISCGNGSAALLYLYIASENGNFSASSAANALNIDIQVVNSALQTLTELHLVQIPHKKDRVPIPQADETPQYTAADIQRELQQGERFHQLVKDVQASLGKILSSDDLVKLFGIYDNLGLPPEVILQLVTHCIAQVQARYGNARMPTMRYIEKNAYTWEQEEIFSLEKAEAYINFLEKRKSVISQIQGVIQIRDRALTKTEQRYIEEWISMGFGADAAEIAFDRTVVKTGKLSWSYMNSILKSWHEKGLHTVDEIEQGDSKRQQSQTYNNHSNINQQKKGPTGADIARMKRMLDKMKNS